MLYRVELNMFSTVLNISSALSTMFLAWSSLDRISSVSLVVAVAAVVDATLPPVAAVAVDFAVSVDTAAGCGPEDEAAFCEPDVVMLSTLHEIDVKTAQYNADIAHFDNCVILFGVNGSNTGSDNANDNTDTSDDISGKQLLIDKASACVTGKYNGLPWMVLSSYRA